MSDHARSFTFLKPYQINNFLKQIRLMEEILHPYFFVALVGFDANSLLFSPPCHLFDRVVAAEDGRFGFQDPSVWRFAGQLHLGKTSPSEGGDATISKSSQKCHLFLFEGLII